MLWWEGKRANDDIAGLAIWQKPTICRQGAKFNLKGRLTQKGVPLPMWGYFLVLNNLFSRSSGKNCRGVNTRCQLLCYALRSFICFSFTNLLKETSVGLAPGLISYLLPENKLLSSGVSVQLQRQAFNKDLFMNQSFYDSNEVS